MRLLRLAGQLGDFADGGDELLLDRSRRPLGVGVEGRRALSCGPGCLLDEVAGGGGDQLVLSGGEGVFGISHSFHPLRELWAAPSTIGPGSPVYCGAASILQCSITIS
jgi:hypothetical protein